MLWNLQENTCARVCFLIKLQASACIHKYFPVNSQVFSCEICEIPKNTFSYRTPPVTTSEIKGVHVMPNQYEKQQSAFFLKKTEQMVTYPKVF